MELTFERLQGRRGQVQQAIAQASQRTGIDFNYLIGQAQVESGMNAGARAGTSSARGLYQFIEQSWLGVVKAHGGEHGMGWAADAIKRTASGRFVVADPATRQAILGLRNDAGAASLMAAEHAADNKAMLETSLDREATGTDLYMAHFLGIGGAKKFLKTLDANPGAPAASLFPAAARANRTIFYTGDGRARSVSEIHDRFAAKLDKGAAAGGAVGLASRALGTPAIDPNVEVVLGSEAQGGDRQWLASTLDQLRSPGRSPSTVPESLLRPKPEHARLAYLMLAQLGV
jgi:hypothetical protein